MLPTFETSESPLISFKRDYEEVDNSYSEMRKYTHRKTKGEILYSFLQLSLNYILNFFLWIYVELTTACDPGENVGLQSNLTT